MYRAASQSLLKKNQKKSNESFDDSRAVNTTVSNDHNTDNMNMIYGQKKKTRQTARIIPIDNIVTDAITIMVLYSFYPHLSSKNEISMFVFQQKPFPFANIY